MKTPSRGPTLLPDLLLVEPQFVLRRTIVAVAHDLGIARFQEATGVDSAVQRLAEKRFDGIVIDISSVASAFELLSRLRLGEFLSRADITIIAMTLPTTDEERDARLSALGRSLILRKPFKVAELLQIVQRLTTVASLQS